MTKQEQFDHICEHLAKQKRPAMDGKQVVYLAPDGAKSPFACLLNDEELKKIKNNYREEWLFLKIKPKNFIWKDVLFLIAMENAHSESRSLNELQVKLKDFAEEFKVNPGKIKLIKKWEGPND